MKIPGILPRLDGFSHRADLWCLSAVLGLIVPFARAQSSVSVKVETYHGAVLSGAKVTATKRAGPDRPEDKEKIIEVLDLTEKETGRYSADRLSAGSYVLFACDDGLKYEPAQSALFSLGDNDSKKVPTLVLGDHPVDQVPISGAGTGAKICLVHKDTGCKATRDIDSNGNILIRGDRDHYDYKPPQACKQDKRGL